MKKTSDGAPLLIGRVVSDATHAAEVLTTLRQDQAAEVFAILCLTTKHAVIAYQEMSRGTLDAALVHPREVFRPPCSRI